MSDTGRRPPIGIRDNLTKMSLDLLLFSQSHHIYLSHEYTQTDTESECVRKECKSCTYNKVHCANLFADFAHFMNCLCLSSQYEVMKMKASLPILMEIRSMVFLFGFPVGNFFQMGDASSQLVCNFIEEDFGSSVCFWTKMVITKLAELTHLILSSYLY